MIERLRRLLLKQTGQRPAQDCARMRIARDRWAVAVVLTHARGILAAPPVQFANRNSLRPTAPCD
jgi:hypothetical protein